MFMGLIVLLIGLIFLLKNLGIITTGFWTIFWPVIVILIGINMLLGRRWWHWWGWPCGPWRFWDEEKHREFHGKMEEEHRKSHEKMPEKESEGGEVEQKPRE